ncbi:MAG TPA: hypothetical protein VE961_07480 [Pyrinomonadaceae bacterium]|nr:hypothetical protein [Pyrinomonadaceae bacterium]
MLRKLCSPMIVLMLLSATAFAQKAGSNWSDVESLKNGTKVVVNTKNGREFVGTKRQATDDTVFIETKFAVQGNRTISLGRDEVASVSKIKSRWMPPLVGLGIGLAAGIAIGSGADHPYSDDPGLGKVVGGALGGAIGLLSGSLLSRKPGTKTIYVAP